MKKPDSLGLITRVTKGLGALSLGSVVNIADRLSIVPVALYFWGAERYGEWVVLAGIIVFLKLADLGLQTYVVNRLCANYSLGKFREMEQDLHSTLKVQIALIVLFLLFVSIVFYILPLGDILNLSTVRGNELFIVVVLLSIEILIGVPMGVVAGLYRATERLPRGAVIGAGQHLTILIVTLILIAFNSDFVTVAVGRVIVAVIASFWVIYDVRKLHPWLSLYPSTGSWYLGLSMIIPGLYFLIIPVADFLSNHITLAIVQRFLEGGEVSRLSTHRTAVNLSMMASTVLMTAVWPEITALHAGGKRDYLIKLRRTVTKMNIWLVGGVVFLILPFLPWLYSSWTVGKLALDEWTLIFLILRILLWSAWNPSLIMLLAVNKHRKAAFSMLLSSLIANISAFFLVPLYGISGAALSVLLGDLLLAVWFIPLLSSFELKDNYFTFWMESTKAMLFGIGLPVFIALTLWNISNSEMTKHFIILPLCLILYLLIIWRLLVPDERDHVYSIFKMIYSRLSKGVVK